jgi:hypothetical protein
MRQPILVVASRHETLMGLSQALLKFGYQVMTAHPEREEIDRGVRMQPSLVILRPPTDPAELKACLDLVRERFASRGVLVLACVATTQEGDAVRRGLGKCQLLTGGRMRLNDLYLKLQELFDMAGRRELRITTEVIVGHREPGVHSEGAFLYDTMISLSMGGCYIKTETPHPVGTTLEIVFCPGDATRTLRLGSTVRHHGNGSGGEPCGMGIEFKALNPEARTTLESYLMSQIGTSEMPADL